MSSIRSEGFKALARGDQYLPRTNTKGPVRSANNLLLRLTVPVVTVFITVEGILNVVNSFKENFFSKRK